MRTGFKKLSNASKLTVVLVGIGICWGVLEALANFTTGDWIQGLAGILFSLVVVLIALKLDSIGRIAQRNNRQARNTKKITENNTTQTAREHSSSPIADLGNRLNSIGLFVPEVIDTKAKGRQAAAVNRDPLRAHRLYAALFGLSSKKDNEQVLPRGRRLAIIGTETLTTKLTTLHDYSVVELLPGIAKAQIDAQIPSGIILEEDAFDQTPWATTLDTTGTNLLRELLEILEQAVSSGIPIYVVRGKKKYLSALSIRSKASLTLPMTDIDTETRSQEFSQPPGRLIAILQNYAEVKE